MPIDLTAYLDPIFIAKLIDFVIFVIAIVWLYNTYIKQQLVRYQEAQNKTVEDAVAYRAERERAVAAAKQAIEQAKIDAVTMVEIGKAQAQRLLIEERTAAQEHAQRIVAHAAGELERERYRVRRELLEETVERATVGARAIVKRDLTPAKQDALVHRVIDELEATHV
jgi:F-type H+-transporting ATPase subunit b